MSDFLEFGSRERDSWSDSGIVEAYVKHFGPITDHVGSEIVGNCISPGDVVLDLCCGQGTLTASIAQAGAVATGLDFSPEMIAKAQETSPDTLIVEGDAMEMPFKDQQFDKVVCNFGMTHIPDQPKALTEIRRVLKPGGQFSMATWAGPADSPAFAAVFGALMDHADFSAAPPQPDLFAFADPEKAKELLAAANLELVEHDTIKSNWVLEKPTELFDIFLTATVGARMLILSQTDETIENIAEAITRTVSEKHRDGTIYKVPVVVAMITARAN